MRKIVRGIAFFVAILLSGFMGFSAASEWTPRWPLQERAAPVAMQLDIDLTEPADKLHETEPEESPSPGDIEVEIIPHRREEGMPLRVLIYHTHTYEAFEPQTKGEYKPAERWRTADPEHNVTRVGSELARILRDEYGMIVVHDATAFEPPVLSTAYQRSLEMLENYMARGETFDLYLDIHRDAYAESRTGGNTAPVGDAEAAHVMFLVGKGSGTHMGQEFAQKPDWEENLSLAESITEAINSKAPGLCRPVSTKNSRYNQHVSTGALLIEVGNNMNSLDEAFASVPYIARAIAAVMYPVWLDMADHP